MTAAERYKAIVRETGLPHLYWSKAHRSWCVRVPRLPYRFDFSWGLGNDALIQFRTVALNADFDALPYLGRPRP